MNRNMCTHPTMERIQANGQTCDICGKIPSMNFLYLCAQDAGSETIREIMERNQTTSMAPEDKPIEAANDKGKSVADESALDALKGKAAVKNDPVVEAKSTAEEKPAVDAPKDKGKAKYVPEDTSTPNPLVAPSPSANAPESKPIPPDSLLDVLKGKPTTTAHAASTSHSAPTPSSPSSPPSKSDLRLRLEHIGLSESVITTAEAGAYTPAQLDRLIAMKEAVKRTITAQTQPRPSAIDTLFSRLSALTDAGSAPKPKPTDVRRSPLELQGLGGGANESQATGPCGIKACHGCRPYFRERTFISLDAVARGEFPPLTTEQVAALPVRDAAVMRTIGLAVPREVVGEVVEEEGSEGTTSSGDDGEDEDEEEE